MDIIKRLKEEIERIDTLPEKEEIGEIVEVKDGVLKIRGLLNAENQELIKIESAGQERTGLIVSIEEENISAILFDDCENIKQGDIVKRTKKSLFVPVGEDFLGRTINALGKPIDGKEEINAKNFYPVEIIAPSVMEREPINTPLHTGIKIIDSLIPIGRGQRELFLGDRNTPKTEIALDVILNQKNEENRPICIYVEIGGREAKLSQHIKFLKEKGALDYTIIVAASSSSPSSFRYLAPYTGMAMAEYFRDQGKDVLIIFDNLTNHAFAWREISLILRRPPGREAYPGDIFYLHSRLLERAGKFSKKRNNGSITALPIIETLEGNISAYIPTNVISICDGQIYFDNNLYLKGERPGINIGLSVSRVGSSAQTKAIKQVSGNLKLELAQFRELENFLQFVDEVDPETKAKIEKGKILVKALSQKEHNPLSFEKETVIIFAAVKGFLSNLKMEDFKKFERDFYYEIEQKNPLVFKTIKEQKKLSPDIEKKLEDIIKNILKKYELSEN